jgi:hypothetical protein
MAQKSAISFVTTLVPFLMLRNSKLVFSKPFICFAIISGFLERLVQWEAAYLPGA